jgi:hypothetical protein
LISVNRLVQMSIARAPSRNTLWRGGEASNNGRILVPGDGGRARSTRQPSPPSARPCPRRQSTPSQPSHPQPPLPPPNRPLSCWLRPARRRRGGPNTTSPCPPPTTPPPAGGEGRARSRRRRTKRREGGITPMAAAEWVATRWMWLGPGTLLRLHTDDTAPLSNIFHPVRRCPPRCRHSRRSWTSPRKVGGMQNKNSTTIVNNFLLQTCSATSTAPICQGQRELSVVAE